MTIDPDLYKELQLLRKKWKDEHAIRPSKTEDAVDVSDSQQLLRDKPEVSDM